MEETSRKISLVRQLRETTGLGLKECKDSLEDAEWDFDTALAVLRERGIAIARRKVAKDRKMTEGVIEIYHHHTKQMAVMVEVNCETDFVANTVSFRKFAQQAARWIIQSGAATVEELLQSTHEWPMEPAFTVEQKMLELIAEVGESVQIRRFHIYRIGESDA